MRQRCVAWHSAMRYHSVHWRCVVARLNDSMRRDERVKRTGSQAKEAQPGGMGCGVVRDKAS